MKKSYLLIFFFLGTWLCSPAQNRRLRGKDSGVFGKYVVQVGGGWGLAWPNLDGYNKVVQEFNALRDINSEEMSEFDQLQGPSGLLTFYGNSKEGSGARMLYELSYHYFQDRNSTYDDLVTNEREIILNMHNFGFGVGGMFIQSQSFDWGLGLGLEGTILDVKLGSLDQEPVSTNSQFLLGLQAFAPIYIGFGAKGPLALSVRPFYQFRFNQADYNPLRAALAPPNTDVMPSDDFKSSPHAFGIEFHFFILLKKTLYQ